MYGEASVMLDVAAAVGDPKARDVLYRNVYGWFERQGNGVYALSPRGIEQTAKWSDTGSDSICRSD